MNALLEELHHFELASSDSEQSISKLNNISNVIHKWNLEKMVCSVYAALHPYLVKM